DFRKPEEEDRPTTAEMFRWLDTVPGMSFGIAIQMRRGGHPEMTPGQALKILSKAGLGQVAKLRKVFEGGSPRLAKLADLAREAGFDPEEIIVSGLGG